MAIRFGITNAFPYMADLEITPGQMGLIMSAHAIAWGISSLVIGTWANIVQKQKLFMVVCLAAAGVLSALVAYAPNVETIIGLRVAIGIFQGPLLPLLQTAVRDVSKPSRVGLNQGILIAGTGLLGQSLPAAIIPSIAERSASAWRSPMAFIGIIGVVIAILLAFSYRPQRTSSAEQFEEVPSKITLKDLGTLFKNRNFVVCLFGAIGAIGWTLCMSSFTAAYLAVDAGVSTVQLSTIIALSGVAGMLSNLFLPGLSDRIGRKPAYIACAIALTGAPLMLLLLGPSMATAWGTGLYVMFFLVGGCAMTLNTYVIVGDSVNPALLTAAYSICLFAGEIFGGALGPPAAGAAADRFGLQAGIMFAAGFGLVCLIVSLVVKESHPRRVSPESVTLAS